MKIKSSELRIGNILEYRTDEGWFRNVVDDLDIQYIDTWGIENTYRPIQITQELVNGCGIDIIIHDKIVGCLIEINDEWDIHLAFFDKLTVSLSPPNVEIPHIQYIHQLQNLYHAITGKELELTIPPYRISSPPNP